MTTTEAARKLQDQIRITQEELSRLSSPAARRELGFRISALNYALSVVLEIDAVDAAHLGY